MDVTARPAPGRASGVGPDDFTDLTPVPVESIGWGEGGRLVVTFAAHLADVEADAVRRRIMSATPAEEALRAELADWLATNPDDSSPLPALIRLMLGDAG